MLEVNDKNFDENVLKSDKLVIVDFWAPWCGPCKVMKPLLEKLEYNNVNIKFVEYNVDDNVVYSAMYTIRSIPNIMFFKDGEMVEQFIGTTSKNILEETINRYNE